MRNQWESPTRAIWEIEYKKIEGLPSSYSWHIKGTMWWVRIYPEVYKLEELDKTKVYKIDAVALNQNYGVIDFYIYGYPKTKD